MINIVPVPGIYLPTSVLQMKKFEIKETARKFYIKNFLVLPTIVARDGGMKK